MFNFFKKQKIILLCLFLLFLALRLPGLHLPYHQDERKAVVGYSSWSSGTPHPPLTRAIFALDASIFGRDNFRAPAPAPRGGFLGGARISWGRAIVTTLPSVCGTPNWARISCPQTLGSAHES